MAHLPLHVACMWTYDETTGEDVYTFFILRSAEHDNVPVPSIPPGSICEQCWDAPALTMVPAPWGGEMGICSPCAGIVI